MAGNCSYIILDTRTRKIVSICSLVTVILFSIGILIGYFSGRGSSSSNSAPVVSIAQAIRNSCKGSSAETPAAKTYFNRFLERHDEKYACVKSQAECWNFGLPRNYIAYHLNGKTINLDGILDDDAWTEVPWSENFVDMRSTVYPKPYLDTKFKIRWDDVSLHIGAYIQENNLWATQHVHDSIIFKENAFEFLIDVDGSLFNYKQAQVNALGTMFDLMLSKSPYESSFQEVANIHWHAYAQCVVHTEGTLNTPGDTDKFWSVEISLPFQRLAEYSQRAQHQPIENETWFVQFGRAEYQLSVTNGQYVKPPNSQPTWWSWQACDAINLHLQDRWGLVSFKRNLQDKQFKFEKWHIYRALFDMLDAMKKYKAINGFYTDAIEELDVPPYLLSRACVDTPKIRLVTNENGTDFDVSVKSMLLSGTPNGHIRSDKYVTFR